MWALIKKSNGNIDSEKIYESSPWNWLANGKVGARGGQKRSLQNQSFECSACWKILQLVKSKQSSSKSWISPLQIENYGENNSREKSFSRKPQHTFLEMQVLGMTRAIWEIVWKVSQETSYIEPSILRQLLLKLPHKDGLKQTRKCYKKFK